MTDSDNREVGVIATLERLLADRLAEEPGLAEDLERDPDAVMRPLLAAVMGPDVDLESVSVNLRGSGDERTVVVSGGEDEVVGFWQPAPDGTFKPVDGAGSVGSKLSFKIDMQGCAWFPSTQ